MVCNKNVNNGIFKLPNLTMMKFKIEKEKNSAWVKQSIYSKNFTMLIVFI